MSLSLPGSANRQQAVRSALAIVAAVVVSFLFLLSPLLALAACAGLLVLSVAMRFPDVATYAVLFLLYTIFPDPRSSIHAPIAPITNAAPAKRRGTRKYAKDEIVRSPKCPSDNV